jgi:chemotaxis protein MotA
MGAVGAIIVIVCVFGGYAANGGHMHIVWQPFEFLIILGAAIGGYVIANPTAIMKLGLSKAAHAWFGKGPSKKEYIEVLQMMFQLFQIFRKDGPQAVERHIEEPEKSEIFKSFPTFLKNHHAVEFLCDTMKITLSADLSPYDVEDLLNDDIKVIHEEEHAASHAINAIAEGLPGLGIVAAVLGVVHTMGILDQGTEAIGHAVGAALIGTFFGVLMCYGFVSPTSAKMNRDIEAEGRYLLVIKAALVALQRGAPPLVCVEYARRTIFPLDRPSFSEMDAAVKQKKAA